MSEIKIQQISKSFGKFAALQKVDFNIQSGELFFLLGPSGCGKTTLLRLIAGFDKPDQGSISFDGKDVSKLAPQERNAAMVFQNYALWPHMTVAQNLAFGLEMHKVAAKDRLQRVQRALSMVKIESLAERFPEQLSGGQQQRVALARALVLEPAIILFDEPLSNLDTKLRLEMRQEIKRLHQALKSTMIYVTHDQGEALSLADRIAVLKDGQLAQIGSSREIYCNPKNSFVAEFIGEANIFPARLISSQNSPLFETPIGSLHTLSSTESLTQHDSLQVCLRPENFRILSETRNDVTNNKLELTVREVMYLGSHYHLTCQARHEQTLGLTLPADNQVPIKPGDNLKVVISPEHVIVLAD